MAAEVEALVRTQPSIAERGEAVNALQAWLRKAETGAKWALKDQGQLLELVGLCAQRRWQTRRRVIGGNIMSVVTFEGIVDDGQIRLKTNIRLPEKTKVYVVVPDIQIEQVAHIFSPRLAHPEQAADFKMEIVEEPSDAGL